VGKAGWGCVSVDDEAAAVSVLEGTDNRIAVVLLDVQDRGDDAACRLKAVAPRVPIVCLTSADVVLTVGPFAAVCVKPISLPKIQAILEKFAR